MMTDRPILLDLEGEITELNCMGKLLAIALQGDISKSPTNGGVRVSEDEATALYWLGNQICRQIETLNNNKTFYAETQEGEGAAGQVA